MLTYKIVINNFLSRIVRYNCPVFESRNLGGARRVASQPVAKITIDPEPCMAMLLEKLRKSDRSLGDCCLCLRGSVMAAAGEWRCEDGCLKLTSVSLERAIR